MPGGHLINNIYKSVCYCILLKVARRELNVHSRFMSGGLYRDEQLKVSHGHVLLVHGRDRVRVPLQLHHEPQQS